jgi:hypothetical protein
MSEERQRIIELSMAQRNARREEQKGKLPLLKLMIATPYYMQQEFSHYGDSMIQTIRLLDGAGIEWQKQSLNGDSYIDQAKNTIVANFLESDCTDLLMIDSDMQWSPDAVARMLRHPQEVVGGFFPMKNQWSVFAGSLNPDANGNVPDLSTAKELWDGSCLFKALLIPGGFLRLKRAVLERFADAYPELIYIAPMADPNRRDRVYTAFFECKITDDLHRCGEDVMFCRRLVDMGVDIWCDPNIDFGHYGVKGFHGNYNSTLLKPKEELEEIYKQRDLLEQNIKFTRFTPEGDEPNEAS